MLEYITKPAKLLFDDGSSLTGISVGAQNDSVGELVFNTSMTGYLETLTDPSFFNQVVVQTFPLIGNYGICKTDQESERSWVSGLILNQICNHPSNFRTEQNLEAWLKENNVVAVSNINTRALTKKIRSGKINRCAIVTNFNKANNLDQESYINSLLENFNGVSQNAVEQTSTKTIKKFTKSDFVYDNSYLQLSKNTVKETHFKICVLDFGIKINIIKNLAFRCEQVIVLPHNTDPDKIKQLSPDGIVLSNGPGDPACNWQIIQNIKKLQTFKIPIFGICLGHQLLALANGAKTQKLTFGHRGSNQPVVETTTKKMFITSQNHGYVVDPNTINPKIARISFSNVNDNTCEGLQFLKFPAFSVQFHPEACAGPNDTNFLFDEFFKLIKATQNLNKKS